MTKAVVTGGAGFIGAHICRTLQEHGVEVVNIDLESGGDVRDVASLKRHFVGAQWVFHLAALPRVQYSLEHPLETNETNVSGLLNVLVAAKESQIKKVVYSSSSSVYGDQDKMPLREDMPPRPKSPYALQKYVGELYCKLFSDVYGLPTVSLRYFNVYGPGGDPNGPYALAIPKFLEQRKTGGPMIIFGDGEQTRDFTHVRDVVRANLLAAESQDVGRGEVINIGAGKNASVNKVAKLIGGPTEHVATRLEPHDTLADNSLAKKLLGWEPSVSLEEGIEELKREAGLA